MRDIKFRTWHIRHKEMIEPRTIPEMSDKGYWYSNSRNEIVLLQYTGLKDKNGKEIYEGDIVTARKQSNTAPFTGYVHFLNAQYWVNYIGYESYYNSLMELHNAEYEPIEIIGNIYENPELMHKV